MRNFLFMNIKIAKIFTAFVMLLASADTLYIYIYEDEFNALYWPSVVVLGSIVFLMSKELEHKKEIAE